MVTLFQLFRDLIEFIRHPEVRHLIENRDDPDEIARVIKKNTYKI